MSSSPRPVALRSQPASEPTITCPHCHEEIKLTESLAAPLLKSREAEFRRLETELRDRAEALRRDRESLEREVAERLAAERRKVAEEEQRRARLALGSEIEAKQRELEEAGRELELTIEKRVSASIGEIRQKARQQAEDELKLKVSEKDQVIQAMQKQIEELRRRAEQGSQQLQGEVQELELESLLGSRFAHDTVTRVPKGEFGGDVLHRVLSANGTLCGTILWESKRTRTWSDGWLAKLRQDQRAARADVAVIVSQALPKGVKHFDLVEGVYVVSPQLLVPVAAMLRKALLELAGARQSSQGRETKAALVYQYLVGPRFRQRIQAIVEAFSSMQDDLNAEKKAIQRQWAKREVQIERAIASTAGLYGDLHGIVGRTLAEVEGLSLAAVGQPDSAPLLLSGDGAT